MNTIHLFPGGNTGNGFVSLFDGITPTGEKNKRVYILKGGPGVGKNTFMKALAMRAEKEGHDVHYFHCASDPESLDAIRIPTLGIVMLDGTAPHVIDPVIPGAGDGIINLGVYLNEKALENKRKEIEDLMEQNSLCFRRAFSYLSAAASLQGLTDSLYTRHANRSALHTVAREILADCPSEKSTAAHRRIFSAAYTPKGYTEMIDSLANGKTVIRLKGPSAINSLLIDELMNSADYLGISTCVYSSPLIPSKHQHLLLEEAGLLLISDHTATKKIEADQEIDTASLLDSGSLLSVQSSITWNQKEASVMIDAAVASLQQGKWIHDQIERIYKANMDFDGVNEYTHRFIGKIFA